MFDCSCLLTGVSLLDHGTTVLLHKSGNRSLPITVGLSGLYDRYGAIDSVDEVSAANAATLRFFRDAYASGRLRIDDPTNSDLGEEISDDMTLDALIRAIALTNTLEIGFSEPSSISMPSILLEDDPLVRAMFAQPIWDTLTRESSNNAVPVLSQIWQEDSIANEIYGSVEAQIGHELRELAAIDRFISSISQLRWTYPEDLEQKYPDVGGNDLDFLVDRALRDYAGIPLAEDALGAYVARAAETARFMDH